MTATLAPLPKKLLPLLILEVLRKYTDDGHHLSQSEIGQMLWIEYEMKVDRKTLHRNIEYLLDAGYPIEYSTAKRDAGKTADEDIVVMSDFWLSHDFTEGELRLLIDGVMFSQHIPQAQRGELVEKLGSLSSKYFASHVRHISAVGVPGPQNAQLFLNIELLDEAIERKRKVKFFYLEYRTDKRSHRKRREDGMVREYVVSPYQMAAKEGKYYLICNYDKYNDISNYRVDRMEDVQVLDGEPAKPFETLEGAGHSKLDLSQYMAEHVYMYSSPNSRCVFRIVKPLISDVIDLFGTDVAFSDETDTHVTVSARVNERAMQQFAKNFGPDVIILKPKRLADKVREEAARTIKAYEELRAVE